MVKPKYHVLVCTSCRANGVQKGFCHSKGAVGLVQRFLEALDERDMTGEVMITNTGCFGICDKGPIVVVYPEAVWYGSVTPGDVDRIVEEHLEGGVAVANLVI